MSQSEASSTCDNESLDVVENCEDLDDEDMIDVDSYTPSVGCYESFEPPGTGSGYLKIFQFIPHQPKIFVDTSWGTGPKQTRMTRGTPIHGINTCEISCSSDAMP